MLLWKRIWKLVKRVINFKELNISFKNIVYVLIGALCSSIAVVWFVRPGTFIPSGMSGTTMLIIMEMDSKLGISVSYSLVYLLLNMILLAFVLGKLGKKFLLLSFAHVFLTSVLIGVLPDLKLTADPVLLAVFGGVINGIGSTIALRANGSTGGTDFIAIYYSMVKNRPQWDKIMLYNGALLIYSGWTYNWTIAFYSIIYQFVSTKLIDTYHNRYKLSSIHVVTHNPDVVSKAMLDVTRHGITQTEAMGVFKQKETSMLYMVASDFELKAIIDAIKAADDKAFIEISTVERIEGNYRQKPLD